MPLSRVVFHCTDQDLFDSFIRGLGRAVLVDPLRKEPSLQKRYFRGYRISKDRPDTTSIAKAYYKEINSKRNEELLTHLCRNWILGHTVLAREALASVGVRNVDPKTDRSWLGRAHDALSEKGHLEAAREVVQALGFDYRLDDILTMISILSVNCDDQAGLRRGIEQEFQSVHDDPQALYSALTSQKDRIAEVLQQLNDTSRTEAQVSKTDVQKLTSELDALREKQGKAITRLREEENTLLHAEQELLTAQRERDAAASAVQAAKAKRTTLDGSIARTQEKIADRSSTAKKRIKSLASEIQGMEGDLSEVSQRLKDAEERIALRAAEHPEDSPAHRKHRSDGAAPESTYTLQEILDFVAAPNFTPSSVTVDIFKLSLERQQSDPNAAPREVESMENAEALSLQYGETALHGSPPWASDILCHYAFYRSLREMDASHEERADIIIGGLYHAGRIEDPAVTERLLGRLIELLDDPTKPLTGRVDVSEAIERIGTRAVDQTTFDRLGALQTKLATANSRALRKLYDALSSRARIVAKRALITKVPGIGVQDTDPTHEVLDLAISYLETLLGPMTNCINVLSRTASLKMEFRQRRQKLLAATAKLRHVFSTSTNTRLTSFRDLLGAHLTEVLASDTLGSYEKFRTILLDYCRRDFRQPEWVSCRYLLPIVTSLAGAVSRADEEIRGQKADIVASIEKQQHPMSTVRANLPLRIRIENTGDATAEDVFVELEADRKEVTIRKRECKVPRMAPGETASHEASMDIGAPVAAVEVACLFRWRDAAGGEQLDEQTLKLTAQREVDWTRAGKNPYTLRSITSVERLVGRDENLETLRIGIRGAQSFCITGQKRVGKTSVARVLAEMFREDEGFVSVYLTLGDCGTTSVAALVHSICGAIVEEMDNVAEGKLELCFPSLEEYRVDQARENRAFRKALERELKDRKVLCVIDDFDEIGEELYKGEKALPLFLWLRGLIDRGYFSLVLVGSEKLPVVLKHQGERLNQVRKHSLNYFRDVVALRRLVVEPCEEYLEYSEGAVERIWAFSAGNPYYATQICAEVYDDMYTRRDHYVAEGDVQRCIDGICRESSVNNFQHLWTDGVFDRGPDTGRTQYLNAAILMACAACSEDGGEVGRGVVTGHVNLRKYDAVEVQFRLDSLVDRGVLLQTADQIRLRVPLFGKWLLTGGEAAVRASFGEEDLETRLARTQSGPTSREVVEVAADVIYDGLRLSEDRIRTWLQQFGLAKNQELAFLLLKRLKEKGYFDDARIQASYKALHRMVLEEFASREGFSQRVEKKRARNVFVASLDPEGKSGTGMLYRYRSANGWPQHLTGTVDDAVGFVSEQFGKERSCAVVFVDDFIGTGQSCLEGLGRFEERLRERLRESKDGPGKVVVGVAAVAGFEDGVEAVRSGVEMSCHVVTYAELGSRDRAFDPRGGIFDTEEDRVAAENLCRSIGLQLEPKYPLGYGDCQALVSFSHRCPNNTLPVFYKSGVGFRGREWFPLFRR